MDSIHSINKEILKKLNVRAVEAQFDSSYEIKEEVLKKINSLVPEEPTYVTITAEEDMLVAYLPGSKIISGYIIDEWGDLYIDGEPVYEVCTSAEVSYDKLHWFNIDNKQVELKKGKNLYFRGKVWDTQFTGAYNTEWTQYYQSKAARVLTSTNSKFELSGSITSMHNYNPKDTELNIPYEFYGLFQGLSITKISDNFLNFIKKSAEGTCSVLFGASKIEDVQNLKIPTEIEYAPVNMSDGIFSSMFTQCPNLKYGIKEFIADEICEDEFYGLYSSCSSLINGTNFKVKVVNKYGLCKVYSNCTSLKNADLTITDLAGENACVNMYVNCGIEHINFIAPTNVSVSCFDTMFLNATNLKESVSILPATVLADSCYKSMYSGCASLTTVPVLPATGNIPYAAYNGMFAGCASLVETPVIHGESFDNLACHFMFRDCTNLKIVKLDALNAPQNAFGNQYGSWLTGVPNTGVLVRKVGATWNPSTIYVPSGWTVVDML